MPVWRRRFQDQIEWRMYQLDDAELPIISYGQQTAGWKAYNAALTSYSVNIVVDGTRQRTQCQSLSLDAVIYHQWRFAIESGR